MLRAKHETDKPVTCPACITLAERDKMPWHKDWADALISRYDEYRKQHDSAMQRRKRQAHATR